jgi:hypothetical protein
MVLAKASKAATHPSLPVVLRKSGCFQTSRPMIRRVLSSEFQIKFSFTVIFWAVSPLRPSSYNQTLVILMKMMNALEKAHTHFNIRGGTLHLNVLH